MRGLGLGKLELIEDGFRSSIEGYLRSGHPETEFVTTDQVRRNWRLLFGGAES